MVSSQLISFRSLQHDTFWNAKDPFGTPMNAFMAVRRWNVNRLMASILASVMASVTTVVFTAAASRSFATGLTAGSYAVGL